MKQKVLPIGYDNFQEIIENDLYYVDKTKLIQDLLEQKKKIVLFPRPRRFGKSLMLSMLDHFFNIEKKEENKHLFDGLKISKSEYMSELSKYPVIRLDFKDFKKNNYDSIYNTYKEMIRSICSDKEYLRDSLNDSAKKIFDRFLAKEAMTDEYPRAIKLLSEWLERYYQEKVIILIDEYDVPIQQGYLSDFYDDVVSLIRSVFSNALKGNDSVKMAVMTGVLRVSKESIFSDLNNVKVYGLLEEEYNDYFGFTNEETQELLKYYDMELTEEVKRMYDGYYFNGIYLYNPWSIVNYASDKRLNNYWINTSGNELIMEVMENVSDDVKVLMEQMISGGEIAFEYNEKITYRDISKMSSVDDIMNFFLATGYVTVKEPGFDENGRLKELRLNDLRAKIPNDEVRSAFGGMLKNYLDKRVVNSSYELRLFKECLLNNNKEKAQTILNKFLMSMSYYDNMENFYHGYMLGILANFISDRYIVKSNRESGNGRFDVMIESYDRKIGMVFEFKVTDSDMEKEKQIVLEQMHDKEYYKELVLDKVETIYEYVIVFKDKECLIG